MREREWLSIPASPPVYLGRKIARPKQPNVAHSGKGSEGAPTELPIQQAASRDHARGCLEGSVERCVELNSSNSQATARRPE